jgi:hypothetical protein
MMEREIGDRGFPIWLLGDSNPVNWESKLKTPLDPRHPARHNIWTALIDVIQDHLFRGCRTRFDTSKVFIRNAIEHARDKPRNKDMDWPLDVTKEVEILHGLLANHKPAILFSFGAFAYEFSRRALRNDRKFAFGHWGAKNLGNAFREQIKGFQSGKVLVIPLLHISISGGRYLSSHREFCGDPDANYFNHVGQKVADLMLQHHEALQIWIE